MDGQCRTQTNHDGTVQIPRALSARLAPVSSMVILRGLGEKQKAFGLLGYSYFLEFMEAKKLLRVRQIFFIESTQLRTLFL